MYNNLETPLVETPPEGNIRHNFQQGPGLALGWNPETDDHMKSETYRSWAQREAHDFIVEWLFWVPCCPNDKAMGGASKYNPLYLSVWFPVVISLLLGRIFHSFFGQGGPVRDNESEDEHAARVQWIYPMNGILFGSLLMNVLKLMYYALIPGSPDEYTVTLTGMAVFSIYMAVNVIFIHAMHIRWSLGVKMVIVGTLAFGIAMLIAFIVEVEQDFDDAHNGVPGSVTVFKVLQYFMRLVFIIFAILAWWIYRRLWHAYRKIGSKDTNDAFTCTREDVCSKKGFRAVYLGVFFVFVVVLIGAAFSPNNGSLHDNIWDALAPTP